MKGKLMKTLLAMLVLFMALPFGHFVSADHDSKKERYKGKTNYYKHDDDDDDDDDEDDDDWEYKSYENDSVNIPPSSQATYWNIWTRETNNGADSDLPIQQAQEMAITLNDQNETIYVIPKNGQLLVSGEKMAKLLQANFKFYQQSKIFEASKGKRELIVRAGSNAAYENMIKTPMPTTAYYFETSLFLPISVIANAFGYRVSWNQDNETIVLQEIL